MYVKGVKYASTIRSTNVSNVNNNVVAFTQIYTEYCIHVPFSSRREGSLWPSILWV